mgnify:FL=1
MATVTQKRVPPLNDWLVYRGRFVNVIFLLQSGEQEYLIRIHEGAIESIQSGPFVMPRWTFRLSADAVAWQKHFDSTPTPGYHDLMAMIKFKHLRLEGDQHMFMSNLLYFKELVQSLAEVVQ